MHVTLAFEHTYFEKHSQDLRQQLFNIKSIIMRKKKPSETFDAPFSLHAPDNIDRKYNIYYYT